MQQKNGYDRLVYTGISIQSIAVDFEKSGIVVKGRVDVFKADPNYGNGFNGQVALEVKSARIKGNAKALFGNVNGTRYWYTDAALEWGSPGIPVFPGMNINGFIGGAWHHMRVQSMQDKITNPALGQTALGAVFIPDANAGLGLRAGVYFNGGSDASYLARTIFEIQCYTNGGVQGAQFYGNLEIMPGKIPVSKAEIVAHAKTLPVSGNAWKDFEANYKPVGKISGPFMLKMDFKNNIFTANASIYLNNIGNNQIKGSGANGKAGEVTAMFARDKWFLRAGTPAQPMSVMASVGAQTAIKCKLYFITGNELLPAAPLPAEVITQLKYSPDLNVKRDLDKLTSGGGFAYGLTFDAAASAGATDKKFSLYAGLRAIAGGDLNLVKYNSNVICIENNETPGVNGWYANGNLFTFIQGKLGAKAGSFSIDVLTLTGAMALNCQAPNPTYANGKLGVEFNLGGFWKFNDFIKIELGSPCQLQQQKINNGSFILNSFPENNSVNVNPIEQYYIEFSTAVNVAFTNPDGKTYKFKWMNPLLQGPAGVVAVQWKWNSDYTKVAVDLNSALAENSNYIIKGVIQLFEITKAGEKLVMINGKVQEESVSILYKTGKLPIQITPVNIAFSWPCINQLNYYPAESKTGKVILKIPQDYLFNVSGTKSIISILDYKGSAVEEIAAQYKNGTVEFVTPKSLKPGKYYRFRIVRVPLNYVNGTGNTTGSYTNASVISAATNLTVAATSNKTAVLLEFWFRCSNYTTFTEKVKDLTVQKVEMNNAGNLIFQLKNTKEEYFEEMEVSNAGALRIRASAFQTPWLDNELRNKVYYLFKKEKPEFYLSRDTSNYGLLPLGAVGVIQESPTAILLNVTDAKSGKDFNYPCTTVDLEYGIRNVSNEDLEDIKSRLSARLITGFISKSVVSDYIHNFNAGARSVTPNSYALVSFPLAPVLPLSSLPGLITSSTPPIASAKTVSTLSGILYDLSMLEVTDYYAQNHYGFSFHHVYAPIVPVELKTSFYRP